MQSILKETHSRTDLLTCNVVSHPTQAGTLTPHISVLVLEEHSKWQHNCTENMLLGYNTKKPISCVNHEQLSPRS
jgi:hypothetical protein